MADKITLIILNYNNAKDTIECVYSLKDKLFINDDVEIVVIDNASKDDSVSMIKTSLGSDITLLEAGVNAGFAAGNNLGIKYALEKGEGYICLLNNDTIAVSDFLTPCINILKENRDVAFITPAIGYYDEERYHNTGMSIQLLRARTSYINKDRPFSYPLKKLIKCDAIEGCCMIFYSTLVKDIGLIPECYFMYFEETEWCYRAKYNKYHCLCLTESLLLHKGQASLKGKSRLASYLYERNRVMFSKRNMNILQFLFFIIFDFIRCVYRTYLDRALGIHYLKWHLDGLLNRIDYSIFTLQDAVWRKDA